MRIRFLFFEVWAGWNAGTLSLQNNGNAPPAGLSLYVLLPFDILFIPNEKDIRNEKNPGLKSTNYLV